MTKPSQQSLIPESMLAARHILDEHPLPDASEPPSPDWNTQETWYAERDDVPAGEPCVPTCSTRCPWRRSQRALAAEDVIAGRDARSWRAPEECAHPSMIDRAIRAGNAWTMICWPAMIQDMAEGDKPMPGITHSFVTDGGAHVRHAGDPDDCQECAQK